LLARFSWPTLLADPAVVVAGQFGIFFSNGKKRKGLQLALEPLNGQGIAGYVPGP
jgi:hypothetical protein